MDLSTHYMGLTLRNPIVPSASPLTRDVDGIRRLEDAGAGAVVMASLFEEQIDLESQQLDHFLTYGTESYAEALLLPEAPLPRDRMIIRDDPRRRMRSSFR